MSEKKRKAVISFWAKKIIFTDAKRIYVYDIKENKYRYMSERDGVELICEVFYRCGSRRLDRLASSMMLNMI